MRVSFLSLTFAEEYDEKGFRHEQMSEFFFVMS